MFFAQIFVKKWIDLHQCLCFLMLIVIAYHIVRRILICNDTNFNMPERNKAVRTNIRKDIPVDDAIIINQVYRKFVQICRKRFSTKRILPIFSYSKN